MKDGTAGGLIPDSTCKASGGHCWSGQVRLPPPPPPFAPVPTPLSVSVSGMPTVDITDFDQSGNTGNATVRYSSLSISLFWQCYGAVLFPLYQPILALLRHGALPSLSAYTGNATVRCCGLFLGDSVVGLVVRECFRDPTRSVAVMPAFTRVFQ